LSWLHLLELQHSLRLRQHRCLLLHLFDLHLLHLVLRRVAELSGETPVRQACRVLLHDHIGGSRLQGDGAGTSANDRARMERASWIPLVVRVVLCRGDSRATQGGLLRHGYALLRVERQRIEVRYRSARRCYRGNIFLAAFALGQHKRARTHGRRQVRPERLLLCRRLLDAGAAGSHLSLTGHIRRHTARPIPLLKEHLAAGIAVDELRGVRDRLLTDRWRHADWHRHGHGLLVATLEYLRRRKLLRHLLLLMCMDHLHLFLEHQLLVLHRKLLLHGRARLWPLPITTGRRA